jgi:hypothetical protein
MVLVAGLAACGADAPGQAAAQAACTAFADTGRHQVASTVAGADAIRATAREKARSAASADPAWKALQRDIEDFYSRQATLQSATAEGMDAYFAADRRVQADCKAAGHDVGPLEP